MPAPHIPKTITVVIPSFSEGERLAVFLGGLAGLEGVDAVVSVPIGDPDAAIARRCAAQVVEGAAGRGAQLAAGAAVAQGEILVFCHADTVLPEGWPEMVRAAIGEPGVAAGAFRLRIAGEGASYRVIEAVANLRSRILRLPYGDQALFTARACLNAAGGFPPLPLMEDVEFVRRIKKRGRLKIMEAAARTSARRWERDGVMAGTVRNWLLLAAYMAGVSPVTLSAWYPPRKPFSPPESEERL